jgi:uncharacterized damage-inducible protein DinB
MRDVVASIEQEYRRYRKLGSGTLEQLDRRRLTERVSRESSSVATIVWHVAGNLESRFTDFLTTDGEKPWRDREDEFADRDASPEEVAEKWARGWEVLESALAELTDDDLPRTVTIRGVAHSVSEALHRSLAHTAYHVGQMTFLGKMLCGQDWTYLSIAPGGTVAYNENPTREKG